MMPDTSPKNLRKFLKSDDLALVRMGLSMAKGVEVPDEMLIEILWMYMFHDDKTIRAAAKSTFIKLAPEDVKQAVKENWMASYRTPSTVTASRGHRLGILGKALGQTSLGGMTEDAPFVRRLIKALRDKDRIVRQDAANALGKIGDERAVEPLIKVLRNKDGIVRDYAVKALETFGDERAVEPLIKLLASRSGSRAVAAKALGTFGDLRAIEPLIKALDYNDSRYYSQAYPYRPFNVRQNAAEALVQFGEPAMDPLLAKLEDNDVSDSAAEVLEKLGKLAVKPLIKVINEGSSKARNAAVEALGNIGDKDAVKPLITVLGDKDSAVRFSAVEALGKIGDERAVKSLIATLEDKDRSVSLSAAEALASNAWTKKGNDEICQSLIEVFEEDWLLAGLVLWSGCHTSEILYQSVSEKLLVSPNEIVSNHWKNVSVSRKFIRSRSGSYRVGGGVLEICKRQTMCRGDDGRKCKGAMVRGDLRLGVELANPNNPEYMTTYYYCASCVSTYIDIQKRYDLIEKWWPQGLKAAQIVHKHQAKEQAEKEKKAELAKKKKEKMKTRWLSISKGTDVPDEIFEEILWTYMFHDDKTIRAAAKSTFIKLAPEDAKQVVKQNWRASYRTEYGPQLGVLGKALCQTSVSLVEPLIKALSDDKWVVRQRAAGALGEIGDARAVKPLIKALGDEVNEFHHRSKVRTSAAEALGKIGDERAVEPLIKMLSDEDSGVWYNATEALGQIGDKRAVKPLIGVLSDVNRWWRWDAAEALGKIGDARAVKPLIKALRDDHHYVRMYATEALGEVGDKRAVEPLIKALSDEDSDVRSYAFKALGKIGDARAVQPLIEILGDNRLSVIKAAAGALGMIGDARAVKPLFKTFENENLGLIKVTAKTIVKIKGSDIEDEERKNVLKFLKSKDPAMVRMGASMLKGILKE